MAETMQERIARINAENAAAGNTTTETPRVVATASLQSSAKSGKQSCTLCVPNGTHSYVLIYTK